MVSRTILTVQNWESANKSWFQGLYSDWENEIIAREVTANHVYQDYARHEKNRGLIERC